MNLIELVTYFRHGGTYEDFCREQALDVNTEVVMVHMQKPLDPITEVVFFEIEKTDGLIEHMYNGITYFHLFDFYFFLSFIEESNSAQYRAFPDSNIARRLLDYIINDA